VSVKISEKVVVKNLRPGNGKGIICNCDVTIAEQITIRDMRLYWGKEGLVQLGAPDEQYMEDGKPKWKKLVLFSEAFELGIRIKLTDECVAAGLLSADGRGAPPPSSDANPFL
jgi:hypothetical protein